ncbi:ADP-ribosylglycohydrolase family protein [Chitinophagaceae bacterium MMS25-I14]
MNERVSYMQLSLTGLSVGDAFGESFFGDKDIIVNHIQNRIIPTTQWQFTDDTIMSAAIYKNLEQYETIDQDVLAKQFAENYSKDPYRGYGGTAHKILRDIGSGVHWKRASSNAFDGMGSMGNGAAMRAALIGAYFHDDIPRLKEETVKSAEVTHSHHEAIVGAMAIAIAASMALNLKLSCELMAPNEFIEQVYKQLEDSDTKSIIRRGLQLPGNYSNHTIVAALGNGIKLMASDTVPFAIWCIAHYLNNYEEALWRAVSVLGDRDTICAIVGSVVVLRTGIESIPQVWKESVESYKEFL